MHYFKMPILLLFCESLIWDCATIRKFTYSCLVDLNIFRIEIYNEQQTRICVIVISKNILVNMWWLFQSIPSRGFWLLLYLSYL